MTFWNSYFKVAVPAQPHDVSPNLWNDEATVRAFYQHDDKYQAAVMEQYKLYVEMTDRISQRRGLANTFFLTLHTAVLTVFGVFWKDRPEGLSPWFLLPVLALTLGLCLAWFWLVRSYRQLNSGKFAVIGALERRLPASPWWNGEWRALRGEERDKSTYWALTHLEIWVPLLFGFAYVFGTFAAIVTQR
jgi:F0F1-type ATP synthase assembly protein I